MSLLSTFIRQTVGLSLLSLFAFTMSPTLDQDKVVAATLGDNFYLTFNASHSFFSF